ncbi:hypothetical protein XarjCFBP7652_05565 [Xanthomonas arboricola]|nr:hypothetical protein XarjCFBP7652_05565 [Xanthomonas arboricola]
MRTGPCPAHRRGTLSGMDAAPEPPGTYLRRVPRWWAGKGLHRSTRSDALRSLFDILQPELKNTCF